MQQPYSTKLLFANQRTCFTLFADSCLPDSHQTNSLGHKVYLFVGKTATTKKQKKAICFQIEDIVTPYFN